MQGLGQYYDPGLLLYRKTKPGCRNSTATRSVSSLKHQILALFVTNYLAQIKSA
jgi:hypothetical protein